MAVFDFRIVSICGSTALMDELVQRMTTSGLAAFSAFAASPDTFAPIRLDNPTTSPRSRPTFAGSMSMAPTILNPGREATCLTMAAPIGPSPKCMTLMLGTRGLYATPQAARHCPRWYDARHGVRRPGRAYARACRVGVPPAAGSRSGERGCHRAEAGRLPQYGGAPASPDHVGGVPRQEPGLRTHQRVNRRHQGDRAGGQAVHRPLGSHHRPEHSARQLRAG